MRFVVLLTLVTACKIGSISALRCALPLAARDRLAGLLAGWLIVQLLLDAGLLFLSLFGAVTPATYWGLLAAILAVTLWLRLRASPQSNPWPGRRSLDPAAIAVALATATVFTALVAHASFFYDTTDDAQNYGLTRIAYWYQSHSILSRVPDRLFHVFAWEWNSDLNALGYFLATGSDRAIAFGSVETWVVFLLAAAFVLKALGCPGATAWATALGLASMPVVLMLSMTVKADVFAAAACLLGAGWTLRRLRGDRSPSGHFWAIAAYSLAAGAKTTVIPLAMVMAGWHALQLGKEIRQSWRWLAGAAALAVLATARHFVNLAQYGRFLTGTAAGGGPPTHLASATETVLGLARNVLLRGTGLGDYFALFGGPGVIVGLGLLLGALAATRRWQRPGAPLLEEPLRAAALPAAAFFGSALVLMAVLPWHDWSFRYYLAWISIATALAFAFHLRRGIQIPPGLFCGGLIAAAALHLAAVWQPSEVSPGSSMGDAFRRVAGESDLERKLGRRREFLPFYQAMLARGGPAGDARRLLFISAEFNWIFPLLGANARNPATFADTPADAATAVRRQAFDLIIVTLPHPAAQEFPELAALGYTVAGRDRGLGITFLTRQNGSRL